MCWNDGSARPPDLSLALCDLEWWLRQASRSITGLVWPWMMAPTGLQIYHWPCVTLNDGSARPPDLSLASCYLQWWLPQAFRSTTGLVWSRMMAPPGLQVYHWPCVTLTLDLLHPSCCDTICICHNICLLGLVKTHQTVLEICRWKGFLWPISASRDLDSRPPGPQVDRFIPLPMDHLCQFASKSVHLFSRQIW